VLAGVDTIRVNAMGALASSRVELLDTYARRTSNAREAIATIQALLNAAEILQTARNVPPDMSSDGPPPSGQAAESDESAGAARD